MCELSTTSTKEKVEGYKIVAKKLKGRIHFFSVTMGFKYPLDGHIPVARKQRKISPAFIDNIISEYSRAHRDSMVGRTAVYLNLNEAQREYRALIRRGDIKEGYKLVVVRSEVSRDVMEGTYLSSGKDCRVAAGRYIHFIEEINHR